MWVIEGNYFHTHKHFMLIITSQWKYFQISQYINKIDWIKRILLSQDEANNICDIFGYRSCFSYRRSVTQIWMSCLPTIPLYIKI